jgi:hypothetical protein
MGRTNFADPAPSVWLAEFPFLDVTVQREQFAMVRRELLNDSTQ